MNFIEKIFRRNPPVMSWEEKVKKAASSASSYGHQYVIEDETWDGEKTYGELNAPINYDILHVDLATRAWQIYLESDICKILVNGYIEWVIGSGLKLQAEPVKEIIEAEGYNVDIQKFVKTVEARFRLHCKTENSAHNGRDTMHTNSRKALKCAMIGGDCLVIYRYEDGGVTTEVIDGRVVATPYGTDFIDKAEAKGNVIIHGVEVDKAGKHVAFYIAQSDGSYKKVDAVGKNTGRIQAVMIYGDEYRIDDVRGVPLFSASIEKLKKIDRYIEAVVSGTEERAKVAYYIFHNHFSDGGNPLAKGIIDQYMNNEGEVKDFNIDAVGKQIVQTTGKTAINMTPGSELRALESTVELKAGEFIKDMMIYISASIGLPYEVAVMMYENSFSASRMASQSWQHIMLNKRELFANKFYKPAYNIHLEMDVMLGKVQAEGYLKSIIDKDRLLTEAYRHARFIGKGVPQADPSKEVKAVVLLLQNKLITHEQACEILSTGDFNTILEKLGLEIEEIQEKIPKEYQNPTNPETDSAELPQEAKV